MRAIGLVLLVLTWLSLAELRQPKVQLARLLLSADTNAAFHPIIWSASSSWPSSASLRCERAFRFTHARLDASADGDDKGLDASEDGDDKVGPDLDQSSLFASLRARQQELEGELVERWRKAECKSWSIQLNSWVRRLSLDWPRAAIGTSDGQVVVADLSTGKMVANQVRAHPAYVDTPASERDMRLLHGDYDGGGTTAMGFRNRAVISAGRDGGAKLWRLVKSANDPTSEALELVSTLRDPGSPAVVSAIQLAGTMPRVAGDDGELQIWLALLDGTVQRWDYELGQKPSLKLVLDAESAVLSIAVLEERGLIACGTSAGTVELFSIDNGTPRGIWRPFGFDGSKAYKGERTRAVAFVPVSKEGQPLVHYLVAGGSEGKIQARLIPGESNEVSVDIFDGASPTQTPMPLTPGHRGTVIALTPLGKAASGLFVSGAHDGTCRLWDLDWSADKGPIAIQGGSSKDQAKDGPLCLYGLDGYKIWLGSVETDGRHLVTDGRDNAVFVADFSDESQ